MIYDVPDPAFIARGHFDGVYNYATLDAAPEFSWGAQLPDGGLFLPGVVPGFLVRRSAGPDESPLIVERKEGATYRAQWQVAQHAGAQPFMITIATFNGWHERTQIEPAAAAAHDGRGFTYENYRSLGPKGYLNLTRDGVEAFKNLRPE